MEVQLSIRLQYRNKAELRLGHIGLISLKLASATNLLQLQAYPNLNLALLLSDCLLFRKIENMNMKLQ